MKRYKMKGIPYSIGVHSDKAELQYGTVNAIVSKEHSHHIEIQECVITSRMGDTIHLSDKLAVEALHKVLGTMLADIQNDNLEWRPSKWELLD